MDGNGQRRMEPHQRQLIDRQQHGGPWIDPLPPNSLQQFHRHLHQQQVFKWCGYDHLSLYYAHPPVSQSSVHQDYWMPQQQYASPLQQQTQVRHEQSRHPGQTYGHQQEEAWRSSYGCDQSQLSQPGSSTGSDEEDWAAKARAWASAKASEEVAQQSLQQAPIPLQTATLEQGQTCEEHLKAVQDASGSTYLSSSLQPWQERAQGFSHDASASFRQSVQLYAQAPFPASVQEDLRPSFGRKASLHLSQVVQEEMVSTSYPQDSSSFGPDITSASALPGTVPQQHTFQMPSQSLPRVLGQPWLSLLPAEVSPHQQSQPFPFPEPVLLHSFEFRQQLACEDYPPQPTVPYLPLTPSACMDSAKMKFCGPPNALPVWTSDCSQKFSPNVMLGVHGGHIGPQFDHPRHQQPRPLHVHQSPHLFPGPRVPGFHLVGPSLDASFGFGVGPSLEQEPGVVGSSYLSDGNGNIGALDRPKKAPVPSWLREELLKKKQAVGMSSTGVVSVTDNSLRVNGPEEIVSAARKGVSDWPRSDSSGMSDNDYEDETQGARTAAINQEIKRVLTEILLRVTDDFFEEIAQELLFENKLLEAESLEQEETLYTSLTTSLLAAPALPVHARGPQVTLEEIRIPSKESSMCVSLGAPVGNVLGLANYASDEDARRGQRWYSMSTDSETESQQNKRNAGQGKSSDHGAGKSSKGLHDGQMVHSGESRDATPIQQLDQGDTQVLERDTEKRGESEGRCQERTLKHSNKRKGQSPESNGLVTSIEERRTYDHETRSRRQTSRSEVEPVLLTKSLVGIGIVDSAISDEQCETENAVRYLSHLRKEKQSVGVVSPNRKKTVDVQSEVVELKEGHSSIFQGQEKDASLGRYKVQSDAAESGAYRSYYQFENRLKDCDSKLNTTRVIERSGDQKLDEENRESHQKVNKRDFHQEAYLENLKVEEGMEHGRDIEMNNRETVKDGNERSRDQQRESTDKKRSRQQSSSSTSKVKSPSRSLSSGGHASRSSGDKFKSPKARCTHIVNKTTSIH